MSYSVKVSLNARRQLRKLDHQIRDRILRRLIELGSNPRPSGARKLAGQGSSPPTFRVRVGEYRIIYRIEDGELVVLVLRVGHRSDVYR